MRHGCPNTEANTAILLLIGREMIEAFLRAPVNSSARDVEHANQAHILYVPVNNPMVAANVDTPEAFEKLRAGTTP